MRVRLPALHLSPRRVSSGRDCERVNAATPTLSLLLHRKGGEVAANVVVVQRWSSKAPVDGMAIANHLSMQPLAGVHVLLVDDDPDARAIMKIIMEYQGALVILATSAKEALVIMETMKPDVLVSDINMPEHDGFWFLEEARRLGRLDGIPTLAVTALDLRVKQLTAAGFHAYLRKPIDPNDLCNSVQALARGRKPEATV